MSLENFLDYLGELHRSIGEFQATRDARRSTSESSGLVLPDAVLERFGRRYTRPTMLFSRAKSARLQHSLVGST